ncbi:MAG: hypothetical protein ATN36_01190 [Epulopiscium sp. Nele67-Bin005]|nr:MAG: hypothetical protein ATN36_01190 [Epulopiscium sp. Nele67-Bin005]
MKKFKLLPIHIVEIAIGTTIATSYCLFHLLSSTSSPATAYWENYSKSIVAVSEDTNFLEMEQPNIINNDTHTELIQNWWNEAIEQLSENDILYSQLEERDTYIMAQSEISL